MHRKVSIGNRRHQPAIIPNRGDDDLMGAGMDQFRCSARLSAITLGLLLAGCGDGQPSDWVTKMKALMGGQSAAPAPIAEPDPQKVRQNKLNELLKKAEAGDVLAMVEVGKAYDLGTHREKPIQSKSPATTARYKVKTTGGIYKVEAPAAASLDEVVSYMENEFQSTPVAIKVFGDTGSNAPLLDFAIAAKWYGSAAEKGNAEAQARLGVLYSKGYGVEKDMAKAIGWWEKAVSQNNALAQYELGDAFLRGKGVPKDFAKALALHEQSASQGYAEAQLGLGMLYVTGDLGFPKDHTKGVKWLQKAAEQGVVKAQLWLGMVYDLGDEDGAMRDAAESFHWYEKAALQGNVSAQFEVGRRYFLGKGVPKDDFKAVEWMQKAAALGEGDAQLGLGRAYLLGNGVAVDNVLAYAWSNLANAKGLERALDTRIAAESEMTPAEIAEAQRLSSGWKVGTVLARESGSAGAGKQPALPGSLTKKNTGTAFIVNAAGHAITNHHVVEGCTEVRAESRDGVVKVVTSDVINDLAQLQIPGAVSAQATIASEPAKLRQGEDIVVFGFPLNAVLSSGGNLTPGVVSALTGLGNNTNQIQITAPIQPGSSGSPVINRKGEVVGVVSMKLSDSKMAKATGQVGQNVNFAVSGQTLKTFLDTHKVEYRGSGMFSFGGKSTADLADEARKWTLVVECWK